MTATTTAPSPSTAVAPSLAPALYRKLAWRIMPFLALCFVLNWLDRVNISFAHLQFKTDLNISDATFGIIVGVFSIGYLLFEIPSNLLLEKIGAKKTMTRIMILWGLVTIATAFAQTPTQFYILRILLGAAEAGFFPGVILYLTYWFPASHRARITSRFIMAIAVCGIVGGPLSTWIMGHFDGSGGYSGWQWLFVLTGIPPVLAGCFAWYWLDDKPASAHWLNADEKQHIQRALAAERNNRQPGGHLNFLGALRDRKVWCIILAYCLTIMCTGNVVNIWAPSIIRDSGVSNLGNLGLLSALPYVVGVGMMFLACRHSDLRKERRWHFALGGLSAALAMLALPSLQSSPVTAILTLIVMTSGYLVATAIFWTIPTYYLSDAAKAAGLALVNCCGQISSLLTPIMIGAIKTSTGNIGPALYIVAILVAIGTLTLLLGVPRQALHDSLAPRRNSP
ncbi:MFS transporter, ACS family, phthalate transporter [Pseudomonas flavescens]|uniref:MFS transporter, ACS family, phthalate transporter n=1 Tax=Phytopseudomonas flavescens TaxID=29435 RepID=A0A1G8ACB2_9GAMM|nr:MFS transporter [Pseudomonas flavescens]SDH18665.1 MFS transporter, ACS family, phthalate transporter [Pseudomonas flavescens]